MSEKDSIAELAERLFEIDKKLNGENALDVIEYNLIIEDIFRRTSGAYLLEEAPLAKKLTKKKDAR